MGDVRGDRAVDQGDDPVGVVGDLGVVGNDDERLLVPASEPDHHAHDVDGRPGVEVAGRLVRENHFRPRDKRARDAHALLLAARHLGGLVVGALFEPHRGEHRHRRLVALRFGDPLEDHRQGDVFERGHGWQEVIGLEDKAQKPLPEDRELVFRQAGNVGLSNIYRAAGGLFKPRELVEQGGFAGTGGPDDADDLPL